MTVLVVVLYVLAVYRGTRLVTTDEFPLFARPREAIRADLRVPDALAYLVTCPWCMSIWIGAALLAGLDLATEHVVPVPLFLLLTASAVTGLIATVEPD